MDDGPKAKRLVVGSALVLLAAGAAVVFLAPRGGAAKHAPVVFAPPATHPSSAPPAGQADAGEDEEDDGAYAFRVPSGRPAELSCDEARRVVAQVRTGLAYEPDGVSPHALAAGAADWLDPHGLWSAAPDSPIEARIDKRAVDLVAEMESRVGDDCPAALDVGGALAKWIAELRGRFDHARATTNEADAAAASEEIPFDAIAYSRPARSFAEDLGARVGAFERAYGPAAKPYADAARERFFPELDAEDWGRALLAAAVRAYVPLVDPHGAWAPLDEEESVYEVDLAGRPPPRLWEKSERTAVGVVLGDGASAPLAPGDLVLSIAGLATAGLPLEQLDQLSYAAADLPESPTAILLRAGDSAPRSVKLDPVDAVEGETDEELLPTERVAYGAGDAIIIPIHDVRDDLGDLLARTIAHERGRAEHGGRDAVRSVWGFVLDLRGNGGGSTDGAISALGLFLPAAPLFPMKRRDGTIETDRAPDPPSEQQWTGPLATLIDGETASAAEMIAGALAVYRRGPSVGTPTYGKGCAQEYVDDEARAGVLRMTTLLYALPDGAAVQRVGLTPTIGLSLAPVEDSEREATLAHAPPSWRGPDVRERRAATDAETWPPHGGVIGPCKDGDVCRALRALGAAPSKNVRATRGGGRR
ncbi:MAG: S41 family peptidase [Polyangiaceae bacterium]|jgi:carboxyl-terminal processing protease